MFSKTPIILIALLLSLSNLSILKHGVHNCIQIFRWGLTSAQKNRIITSCFFSIITSHYRIRSNFIAMVFHCWHILLSIQIIFLLPFYWLSTCEVSLLNGLLFTELQLTHFRLSLQFIKTWAVYWDWSTLLSKLSAPTIPAVSCSFVHYQQ